MSDSLFTVRSRCWRPPAGATGISMHDVRSHGDRRVGRTAGRILPLRWKRRRGDDAPEPAEAGRVPSAPVKALFAEITAGTSALRCGAAVRHQETRPRRCADLKQRANANSVEILLKDDCGHDQTARRHRLHGEGARRAVGRAVVDLAGKQCRVDVDENFVVSSYRSRESKDRLTPSAASRLP